MATEIANLCTGAPAAKGTIGNQIKNRISIFASNLYRSSISAEKEGFVTRRKEIFLK